MRGKLIVLEGIDCSGKQTQSELLTVNLQAMGMKAKHLSFPDYETPTGKIIAGPLLGNPVYGESYFDSYEQIDPKIRSLYYAADRRAQKKQIEQWLDDGYFVILDRYTTSNMGYQGSFYQTKEEREAFFDWIWQLEFDLLELPQPDLLLYLQVPTRMVQVLRKNREVLDTVEENDALLEQTELCYQELVKRFVHETILCCEEQMKEIGVIQKEILEAVMKMISRKTLEQQIIDAMKDENS